MRVGSLFSGIGGIELGLERAGGFHTTWFVEWNSYCQEILKKNWPGIPIYGDVTTIAWETMPAIDVLTGGFPCQPHSLAGKRQASNDDRDLWPECRRAIAVLKPRACIFENVPGLLTSEKGAFFKKIIDDFYRLGYRPCVYRLSARDVGAPHLRRRIFIVAYAEREFLRIESRRGSGQSGACASQPAEHGKEGIVADSESMLRSAIKRDEQNGILPENAAYSDNAGCQEQWERISEESPPTTSELGGWWESEPDVGRVAHGVPFRVDRLKCLGNAVVPQCAQVIGEIVKRTLAISERPSVSDLVQGSPANLSEGDEELSEVQR